MWPKRLQRAAPSTRRRSPPTTPLLVGTGVPVFGLGLALPAAGLLPAHAAWIALAACSLAQITWIVFHYRLRLRREDRLDRLADVAIREEGLGHATRLYLAELAARNDPQA